MGEAPLDDDAKRRQVLSVCGEGVGRDEPASLSQRARDVEDAEVVDFVPNLEGEHRQLVALREQLERSQLADLLCESHGDFTRVRLHLAITGEAEPEEVVVLGDHLRAWPREVEREGRHVVAEVVDPEDQVFREGGGVAPDDPAYARVDESVLVARRVDRSHAGQPEVPLQVGVDERRDERARGAVDVNRNVEARALLEVVERRADSATGS